MRTWLSLALLGFVLASSPASAVSITVSAPASASVGGNVDVVVGIEGLGEDGLGAFDLTLQFDAAILSFQSVDYASALGLPGAGDAIAEEKSGPGGLLNVALVSLLAAAELQNLGSSVVLFTAHFTAAASGSSSLGFASGALFGDAFGASLGTPGAGSAHVDVVPEPSAALLFVSIFGIAARGRARWSAH
jgi:hypothetical protein